MKSSILSQTESEQLVFSDVWSLDFTCATVPLAEADTDVVSSSLLPLDRRDGRDFSTAYVPQGITTAKVTSFFLSIKKPLHKLRYSSVSLSPVFSFPLQPPYSVHCPLCPPLSICRSRTGQTYWDKPWALGFWIHPGKAQPEESSFLGRSRAQECQGWSPLLGRCSEWWRGLRALPPGRVWVGERGATKKIKTKGKGTTDYN